jgi:hypothetical protein
MDVTSFRPAFAASLGAEDFRKFVVQLRRAGRMRYWHEGTWRAFVAAHPEFDCTTDELLAALRVCELHGCELRPDDVEVFRGCRDYADRYLKARDRLFPNAATGPVSTERAAVQGDAVRVWYCAECRAAESDWLPRRP